jgi:hypothetical protein
MPRLRPLSLLSPQYHTSCRQEAPTNIYQPRNALIQTNILNTRNLHRFIHETEATATRPHRRQVQCTRIILHLPPQEHLIAHIKRTPTINPHTRPNIPHTVEKRLIRNILQVTTHRKIHGVSKETHNMRNKLRNANTTTILQRLRHSPRMRTCNSSHRSTTHHRPTHYIVHTPLPRSLDREVVQQVHPTGRIPNMAGRPTSVRRQRPRISTHNPSQLETTDSTKLCNMVQELEGRCRGGYATRSGHVQWAMKTQAMNRHTRCLWTRFLRRGLRMGENAVRTSRGILSYLRVPCFAWRGL